MKSALIVLTLFFVHPSFGENKIIVPKKCKVEFETTGSPTMIRISGKSDTECEGKISYNEKGLIEGFFQLPLDKLDTGIPLRNKHLRENYLDIASFPTAKLTLKEAEMFNEQVNGKFGKQNKFVAALEMHGKEVSITDGIYEVKGNKVTAKFSIDLPAFDVERPSFMGIKVVDKVHLTITLEK
jgi:hypothetical protein